MFVVIHTVLGAAVLPSSCVERPPLTERLITLESEVLILILILSHSARNLSVYWKSWSCVTR